MNEFQIQLYRAWCRVWEKSDDKSRRLLAIHHIKRMNEMYEGISYA